MVGKFRCPEPMNALLNVSDFLSENRQTTTVRSWFDIKNVHHSKPKDKSLLAFIALSAAQSSAQTHIHSAIVVIDTSNNA